MEVHMLYTATSRGGQLLDRIGMHSHRHLRQRCPAMTDQGIFQRIVLRCRPSERMGVALDHIGQFIIHLASLQIKHVSLAMAGHFADSSELI